MNDRNPQDPRPEIEEKHGRVRQLLEDKGLDGLLLTTQPNVTWMLGGRDHWVSRSMERAFAWTYVTADARYVLALDNERNRLIEEVEVERLGFELVTVPWWKSLEDAADSVAGRRTGTDNYGAGESVALEVQRARLQLTDAERDRIAALGEDARSALESQLADLDAGTMPALRERDLGAGIVAGFERRGIVTGGLMVGGDERRQRYRHPVVTDAPLGKTAMVVVIAVRGGLNVAITRTVSAGSVEPALAERHRVASAVEAEMIAASVPGANWGGALEKGLEVYAAHSFPDEWKHHTQGGPIGYGPREYIAYPAGEGPELPSAAVLEGQAFAWNPTVQGAKSEDTFVVASDGPFSVTNGGEWPTLSFETAAGPLSRPDILVV